MLLAASAGVLGAAALFAGPAFGDSTTLPVAPAIQIGPMAADGSVHVTYTDPSTQGTQSVDLNSLTLTYKWDPTTTGPAGVPTPPSPSSPVAGSCTGSGPVTCTYAFPATMMDGTYVLNGNYQLVAMGKDCPLGVDLGIGNCSAISSVTQSDGLNNPATTPTDVIATTGPKGAAPVTISWTPSPEPDVAGYYVYRSDGSVACTLSEFDPPPAATSCQDTNPGGGTFTYTVKAARFGTSYASADLVIGNASAASESVTVTGPPATTTTVPKSSSTTLPSLGPSGFKPVVVPTKIPTTGGSGSKGLSALPAGASSSATTPSTSGGGYNPLLPYGSIPQPASPTTLDPAAISVPAPPHKGSSIETIAVVGAGLLVAVLALHGLWLRSEVRRAGTLEPLDPEA